MTLWTAAAAAAATAGILQGSQDWTAQGISIDSRSVLPGDLFIAVQGPNFDGHDFVKTALGNGAAAAMVHRIPDDCHDLPLLLVSDTMAGLQDLGRAGRNRSAARIVAVTGSVGKTGTKEMLALALAEQGKTHWSVGNFNNHWGVPLSLARMPADSQYAVFELGMNHAGEIAPLVAMVRPHVAIITTVEAVHAAHFSNTEEIAAAKAEILTGLAADGAVVLNRDNRHFPQLYASAWALGLRSILSFGTHIDADARLMDCAVDPESTAVFALFGDKSLSYRIGLPGLHWAMNSLAALLAIEKLGADREQAARSLARMSPPKGRGERHRISVQGGHAVLIDESYNASPVSMRAAISTLAAVKPSKNGRRHAILGDMLELGDQAPTLHADLARFLHAWNIEQVHCAGSFMHSLYTALPPHQRGLCATSAADLAPQIRALIQPGDVVMVKGSAGSRMNQIVKCLLEG